MFQAPVSSTRAVRRTLRWIVLLPVVMVGSLLYWSIALSMGGLSLITATALSASATLIPGPTDSPALESGATLELRDSDSSSGRVGSIVPGSILVHLEESAEPEDDSDDMNEDDNQGAVSMTPAADDYAVSKAGPGTTSY
jgi:hypothetical protein